MANFPLCWCCSKLECSLQCLHLTGFSIICICLQCFRSPFPWVECTIAHTTFVFVPKLCYNLFKLQQKSKKKRFNENKVKKSDFYCCRLFKGAIRNVHLSLETEINRCKKLYLSYSYITSLSKLIKKNYWFICGGTSWTKVIQVFDCSISSGKEKEIALPLPVTIVINSTFKPAQRFNNILF